MEEHRFDDLTRVLATDRRSRRRLLRGLLGGSMAGALALLGLGHGADAEAARRRKRRRRPNRPNRPNRPGGVQSDPRCPVGKALIDGQSCPLATSNSPDLFCGRLSADLCVLATDGSRQCADLQQADCGAAPCVQNTDCAAGQVCGIVGGCCQGLPTKVCLPKAP